MDFKTLIFEKENDIGIVTLNRPKAFNALNDELVKELCSVMDVIAADPAVKAVIITGGNKVFAAGGDINYMSSATTLVAEEFIAICHEAMDKIDNLDKPVIAAVGGLALGGGCELALACDIRIASEEAIFGQPEINLGIMPGAGGTQRLAKTVGVSWAKQLIYTGDNIKAAEALQIGLVTKVVPGDALMDEAKKLAGKLASKGTIAMRMAKKCINYGMSVDLKSGLLFEQKIWAFLFSTEDQKEGMKAFIEKRKPQFKDR